MRRRPLKLKQEKIETGNNSSDAAAYMPPCPPLGKHRYVFRLYALDIPQIHPARVDREGVMEAMTGHVLAYGEIVGLFRRLTEPDARRCPVPDSFAPLLRLQVIQPIPKPGG